jgi:hypothetical protein
MTSADDKVTNRIEKYAVRLFSGNREAELSFCRVIPQIAFWKFNCANDKLKQKSRFYCRNFRLEKLFTGLMINFVRFITKILFLITKEIKIFICRIMRFLRL